MALDNSGDTLSSRVDKLHTTKVLRLFPLAVPVWFTGGIGLNSVDLENRCSRRVAIETLENDLSLFDMGLIFCRRCKSVTLSLNDAGDIIIK